MCQKWRMAEGSTDLPTDVETLQAMVVAMQEREAQLRHIIDQLQRWRFGPRSEKLSPDQYDLTLEDREIATAEAQALLEMQEDVADRARGNARSANLAKAGPRFRPICRTSSGCCCRMPRAARAVVARCTRLTATLPNGSTRCPRVTGSSSLSGLSWRVGPVATASYRRPRRPGSFRADYRQTPSSPTSWSRHYMRNRTRDCAERLLGEFHGFVQCDGYGAYKHIEKADRRGGPGTLVFCWAHVRRGFFDIARAGNAPIADEALARIARLYKIEKEIRGQSPPDRRARRQNDSKPIVESLKVWLEEPLPRLSRSAKLGEKIRYALNHWPGLIRFLEDGRLEIDNNSVERSMRPVALQRKNALFAGHDLGAENWAAITSLVETCKLNDVNPTAYLTDILPQLVSRADGENIDDSLPANWVRTRAGQVDCEFAKVA